MVRLITKELNYTYVSSTFVTEGYKSSSDARSLIKIRIFAPELRTLDVHFQRLIFPIEKARLDGQAASASDMMQEEKTLVSPNRQNRV